jgi:TfoX/Sxy family transcriptional regulator of competence genes
MAYDEKLAERVRASLAERGDVAERKMFGGLCFLVGGNMAVGIVGSDLMVRVGPDAYAAALGKPHAREMDFTGRPMRGMVYVDATGLRSRRQLDTWVGRGLSFAAGLPRK